MQKLMRYSLSFAAIVFVLLAFAVCFTGCTTNPSGAIRLLPDGNYKSLKAVVTGKFSATEFEGTNATIANGKLTAGKLHLRHSNAYVPLIEFEIEAAEPFAVPAAK